jgi:hypothetical protein
MLPPECFHAPGTSIKKARRFGRDDVNTSLIDPAISALHGKRLTLIKVIFKGIQTQQVVRAEVTV